MIAGDPRDESPFDDQYVQSAGTSRPPDKIKSTDEDSEQVYDKAEPAKPKRIIIKARLINE
jgi:hypothetical protein